MTTRTGILCSAVLVLVALGAIRSPGFEPAQRPPHDSTNADTAAGTTRPALASALVHRGVRVQYLRYAGFKIEHRGTVVYIDPLFLWELDDPALEPADFIVVTHAHLTHCSPRDIEALSDRDTITIGSPDVANTKDDAQNRRHFVPDHVARPGESLVVGDVRFEFVPMYNVDPSRTWAHPPGTDDFGVVVELGGVRVYHASDTDRIPELADVRADIALLPVSGYAEMSAEEAADAVRDLMMGSELQHAVPMHWNSYTGDIFDAYRFHELAPVDVVLLAPLTDDPLPPATTVPR